jgi:diguanylate cyclase (GGDEF)-like protein
MNVRSTIAAARAFGRRLAGAGPVSARDRGSDLALKRHLRWATPSATAFAGLAAVAGAGFGDRPSGVGALAVVLALAMVPVLVAGLARRLRGRLEVAITEREVFRLELDAACRTTEKFRAIASHDDLTGLPNRALLYDRLGVAIAQSSRQATHLALLFLDLDDFKGVNDSFGHGAGDRLLVELARRVGISVRAGDTVARFGGDEFVVLLDPVSGTRDATRVAAKVLQVAQAPYRLDGHEVSVGVSVGVSVYPEDGVSFDELVRSADAAMYRAKHGSTARVPRAQPRPEWSGTESGGPVGPVVQCDDTGRGGEP